MHLQKPYYLKKNHVVKRMQNVSDRPPSRFQKLPNFFLFFSQAVFPAFGEETQLGVSGYLQLRLDFLPSHSPKSKEVENPQSNKGKPFGYVFGGIIPPPKNKNKNRPTNGTISLSQPIP